MRKKILLGIMLLSLLVVQFSFVSFADQNDTITQMQQREAETQATISNLEKQTLETRNAISQLQGEKQQTQANVSDLETKSNVLQGTINGYNDQLTSLNDEISVAEEALAEVSDQIVQLNKELQEAQQMEKDRYELLKERLQSTYESGGTSGLIRMILESGSISELLTKFEYINAIVRYDRQKMAEYRQLQEEIESKKLVVEEREAELDKYQSELDEDYQELSDLTDTVKGQLSSTKNSLSSEKNKLASYDDQLKDLDEKMKALEAQVAAAQAKLAQQVAERLALTKEDTSGSYAASDTELVWLAATIQAEAGGESYTGKLGVGSVIMNRVKSSAFPNTVIGVITQNMQFASYRSGKVELIISNGPNSTCIRAAQEVLNGARIGDYLFFMTQYWADYYRITSYTMIGNHAFFYRWETYDPPEEETTSEEAVAAEETENTESQESQEQESQEQESQEQQESTDEGDGGDDDDDHSDEGDQDSGGDD